MFLEMAERQKHSKKSQNDFESYEKYGLLSEVRRRKWVNLGLQVHKYENLLTALLVVMLLMAVAG